MVNNKNASFKKKLGWAWDGLIYTLTTEKNMKIHGAAAVTVVATGIWLRISRLEWGLLVITIFMVLAAETINTAVEKAVDLYTEDYHPSAEIAKNVGAAAVLLTAVAAVMMGIIIFGGRIVNFLR